MVLGIAGTFKNRSKRISNYFLNLADSIAGPNGKLRIVIDERQAYVKYVDVTDNETKYPIDEVEGEYANVAFFFKGISEEVSFDPVVEDVERTEDGHAELGGIDVHTTDYIDTFMRQKTFKDMLYTRAREGIDEKTMQYIMLGLIGIILALIVATMLG